MRHQGKAALCAALLSLMGCAVPQEDVLAEPVMIPEAVLADPVLERSTGAPCPEDPLEQPDEGIGGTGCLPVE